MEIEKQDLVLLAQFRTAIRGFLRFSESKARHAGITPQQHQMLLAIRGTPERDWATPGEVAASLQINHNAAVGLITRAEKAGLVARSANPRDQRSVCVTVTQKGEEILQQLSGEHKRELERVAPVLRGLLVMAEGQVPHL